MLALMVGCRGVGTSAHRDALHPGDSILDRLQSVEVETYPATNLPQNLRGLIGSPARMERLVDKREFIYAGPVPPTLAESLDEPVSHWCAQLGVTLSADDEPIIRHHGDILPQWRPGDGPPPEHHAWYDSEMGSLFAIVRLGGETDGPPRGLSLEYTVDFASEMRPWE